MKPCGRCEDSSATCDRDPTEYSFGLASECSPCPDGWVGTVDTVEIYKWRILHKWTFHMKFIKQAFGKFNKGLGHLTPDFGLIFC